MDSKSNKNKYNIESIAYLFSPYINLIIRGIIVLNLVSCSTKKEQITDNPIIILEDVNEVKFDELFLPANKEVQLESSEETMLSDDLHFYFYDDNIYVLDKSQVKLLRFQSDGSFITEIGRVGRGPSELPRISNFFVDENGVTSISTAGSTTKIFNDNENGEVINSQTLNDFVVFDIEKLNGNFQLYTGYNKVVHPYRLYALDTNLNEMGTHLKNDYSGNLIPVNEKNFYKWDNQLFLKESLSPIICEIFDQNIRPVYQFDFGRYSVPSEYWEMDGIKGYEFIFKRGVAIVRFFMQNDHYALIVVVVQHDNEKSKIHYIIHDRDNDQFKKAVIEENIEYPNYATPISISKDNEILFLGYPDLETAKNNNGLGMKNPSIRYRKIG